MIKLLPEPKLLKTISDGENNYFSCIFNGAQGKKVVMFWFGEEKIFKEGKIRQFDSEANSEIKKIPVEGKKPCLSV